jgi:hypothetical protein
MESLIDVARVETTQTRNGNTRYVVSAGDGSEYTTFRPQIGEQAKAFEGRRARVEFHEEERNGFRNVYLDGISAAPDEPCDGDTDPAEVGWRSAVEAAPFLLGEEKQGEAVDPDELFAKLKPFKDRVEEDIAGSDG